MQGTVGSKTVPACCIPCAQQKGARDPAPEGSSGTRYQQRHPKESSQTQKITMKRENAKGALGAARGKPRLRLCSQDYSHLRCGQGKSGLGWPSKTRGGPTHWPCPAEPLLRWKGRGGMTRGSLGAVPLYLHHQPLRGSCTTFCCTRQHVAKKVSEAACPQDPTGSLPAALRPCCHRPRGRGHSPPAARAWPGAPRP